MNLCSEFHLETFNFGKHSAELPVLSVSLSKRFKFKFIFYMMNEKNNFCLSSLKLFTLIAVFPIHVLLNIMNQQTTRNLIKYWLQSGNGIKYITSAVSNCNSLENHNCFALIVWLYYPLLINAFLFWSAVWFPIIYRTKWYNLAVPAVRKIINSRRRWFALSAWLLTFVMNL